MRLVSAADIMQQARAWTDREAAPNPSDSALLGFLNQSFPRYYNKVAEAYGSDFYWQTANFTTVSGVSDYALPVDCLQLRRMDIQLQAPPNPLYRICTRFDEALRDSYNFGTQPAIQAGQTFLVSYTPVAPVLSQYASSSFLAIDGISSLTVTAVQPGVHGANVTLTLQRSLSESVVGGGFEIIITYTSSSTLGSIFALSGWSSATVANLVSRSIYGSGAIAFAPGASSLPLGGTIQFDFINGWERILIADLAAMICKRLNMPFVDWVQEREALLEDVLAQSQNRDAGWPLTAPDNMLGQAVQGPFAPFFNQNYGYWLQGQNIHLLREGLI